MRQIDLETVIAIHDAVICEEEVQGLAPDKSLESCLARIDNRVRFGMVDDIYHLAALYAYVIASGHCFNDANKRTAVNVMDVILCLNGIELDFTDLNLGEMIIAMVNGAKDEIALAAWLRSQPQR